MKPVLNILLLLCFLLPSGFLKADDDSTYTYQNRHPNHPDGVVSKLSFRFTGNHQSVKKQRGEYTIDRQQYTGSVWWVVSNKFILKNSFQILKEDSIRYQFKSGFRYYLSDPINSRKAKNPDGPLTSLVFDLDGGFRYDENPDTKSKYFVQSIITIPIKTSFSLFGGYTNYDEIEQTDTDELFGGVTLFFSKYKPESPYDNPDSPSSGAALKLLAGTSKIGSFSEFNIILPPSNSVSINFKARVEHLDPPFDKIYTGEIGISIYSGK